LKPRTYHQRHGGQEFSPKEIEESLDSFLLCETLESEFILEEIEEDVKEDLISNDSKPPSFGSLDFENEYFLIESVPSVGSGDSSSIMSNSSASSNYALSTISTVSLRSNNSFNENPLIQTVNELNEDETVLELPNVEPLNEDEFSTYVGSQPESYLTRLMENPEDILHFSDLVDIFSKLIDSYCLSHLKPLPEQVSINIYSKKYAKKMLEYYNTDRIDFEQFFKATRCLSPRRIVNVYDSDCEEKELEPDKKINDTYSDLSNFDSELTVGLTYNYERIASPLASKVIFDVQSQQSV